MASHATSPAPMPALKVALDQARFVINFPPVFGYDGLSQLLGRSRETLQADRCRKPHSLPPPCSPPGTKQPLWLLEDVIAWLEQYRQPTAAQPAAKKRGRPTKAEQIARRAGGVSHGK